MVMQRQYTMTGTPGTSDLFGDAFRGLLVEGS